MGGGGSETSSRKFQRCALSMRNLGSWFQNISANRTITWAQLIGLQGIQHAERVCRAAADVQIGHINVLNHVVRVDNICRAIGNAFRRLTHAKTINQLTAGVRKLPDRQLCEVCVVAAPCQLHELVVGGPAEHNRVAIFEVAGQAGEFSDFGWANEGEVFRVEEDDFPFTLKGILRDGLECAFAILLILG